MARIIHEPGGSGLVLLYFLMYGETMAGPLRIEYPGAVVHVTAEGNARMPIFEDDSDRAGFLQIAEVAIERFTWRCHAFRLTGNHYHLLPETIGGNLSAGMRHIDGVYTQRFNSIHHRVGHSFQGRFKSIPIDRDACLLELCSCIVLSIP